MELIRKIVKVGNSAGVVLPREWLNGTARVELVKKPLDINKDILEILEPYLEDVIGVYLTGSYARGEERKNSDVDVLVITNKISKKIESGKYNIIMVNEKDLMEHVNKIALPLMPMIVEAKSFINSNLLRQISEKIQITKQNVRPIIELAKSALKINRSFLDLDKELGQYTGTAVAYSLILNLRSLYLINCLRRNKKWSSKELKSIIKRVAGSLILYEGYIRNKNDEKPREDIPINEAEKLYAYVDNEIKEVEKWLRGKKD